MKILFTFITILFLSSVLYAQVPGRPGGTTRPPLLTREVSGIVKDSTDEAVIGATVKLKTATDSAVTTTNADGIFIFKNVRSATFVITITNIGYRPMVKRMLNNDAIPRLVLDPFVLNTDSRVLDAVTVQAPSITYKTDTVEYRASDYKVRPNATVDEVLKKMEGMEVGSDGSVTHQGQSVTKVKLNGKVYSGGNVAQAIQNLPADIVDKIQVVDDYGDAAARTGIKDGDPEKVLNITTRADRSVGNIIRANAGVGNDKRYEGRLFLQRLNGNQQVGVIGDLRNTVNGVASTGSNGGSAGGPGGPGGGQGGNSSSSGSGGTTRTGGPTISYSDQWGKKIQVTGSYGFNFSNVNSLNNSNGQQFFNTLTQNRGDSTIFFVANSQAQNNRKTHRFEFKMDYQIDSANFLQITPTVNIANADNLSQSSRFETGLRHQDRLGLNNSFNRSPSFGGLVFYQHLFKKPRRNLSFQVNYNTAKVEQDNEQNNNIIYYADASDRVLKDSVVHRYIERDNLTRNIRTSFTYVEPLTTTSQVEFNAQVNYRGYDNTAFTSNILNNGQRVNIDSLSNVYNYSFTESRIALNYRVNQTKYNLSLGVTAVPTNLSGTRVSQGNVTSDRSYFNLIPIARFQYVWSRQQRFSVNYTGNPQEPTFNQIQPVRDVSNPQNPVVGNPDLKPAFRHTILTQYNNYIANSKLNLSANVNTSIVANQIVTNNVRIPDAYGAFKNETRFVNLNGNYSVNGNYNIQKQLADRKYNLSLNGSVGYAKNISMLNNVTNDRVVWRLNERLGPRMNPNETIELNPYVVYDITRTFFASNPASNTDIRTTAIAIDGKLYLLKNRTLEFGYNGSKNFVSGIPNYLSRNPLVINAYIENQFFARRSLTVRFQVFDILKQNNFVNQVTTDNSVTNTLTNALSRYFMFSVRANLQKWTGSPSRGGRALRRRGDGSFIEP
ncbi:TonB-dependent receptor family protein [Mucilaginibacter daejeonensis]|uniref:outer membrane beta-barrel protein n=1 Tax=Mucilaginibacter daejeonensis TaxID=398049 RepID=UPI001D1757AE|nr:outer membrane beta-barrel protein [Mucilaginibacter daejeonensis]UEG51584.1 TonB-dependent receptor family protein [Mucilaginibacter daejeonensis]